MHRKANTVVDLLASKGVDSYTMLHYFDFSRIEDDPLREECQILIQKDHPSLDAGDMTRSCETSSCHAQADGVLHCHL